MDRVLRYRWWAGIMMVDIHVSCVGITCCLYSCVVCLDKVWWVGIPGGRGDYV